MKVEFHLLIFFSFGIAVLLDDRQFPAAFASNKREASIHAAYKAFHYLSSQARQVQVNIFFPFETKKQRHHSNA